jgi:superfamily II DNA or RNA helicase
MSALHPRASYWIRRGVFDDLRSFEAFEARVNEIPQEKDRGDVFEIFIEGYLATQTITQCIKHYVVGNIPLSIRERYKLPSDATGIDGIYDTHDGSQIAYQVKYRQKQQLTFAEVAPFLGITEQFSERVIFTNATTLSEKAVVRTRWVSGEVFRALSSDALSSIEAWLKERPLPIVRAKPEPSYQLQALADIKTAFAKHDRATAVLACGTGKTLISLWAAEQENPKTVLVLVPSLTLLQQTLLEWSEQTNWGGAFSYLCVCSDPTVGLKDDALNIDKSEVGFRIDTDPAVVRRFLEHLTTDVKVIFSTYHSSPVVAEGARGLPPFDLAIFDEAHKTIGLAGSAFGHAIADKNIRIKKRLFLTATPRHVDIRHRDKEGEFRVYSMDDETVYGPRAHTLSFAAAAQKGIICSYKVIISFIDKQMVDDFTRRRGITLVAKDEVGARWMANLIAVQQAIERVGANKIISFHGLVRLAQEFASREPRGIAFHLRDFQVRNVNGEQSSGVRAEIIELFKNAPKALLTNARCLTEGINIPAVDMVAFIDPRQSRVDITQAVGRAMRKPRGQTTKTVGYVVVPLFAGMGEKHSLDEAIKSEKFEAVVDVLNALQEHDDELIDIIREIRERKGAGEPFNPKRLNEKVEVIGPRIDLNRLTTSISVEIADRIGSRWDEWFGMLMHFKAREGHSNVPQPHVEGTFRLGQWVSGQRANKETMSAERRQRLNEIGFIWNVLESVWEEGFTALTAFKTREAHCNVPQPHVEETFNLGIWVATQRRNKDTMSAERRQRLDEISFVWDAREAMWEEGLAALKAFKAREGHCRVPRNHMEGSFKLGQWAGVQRTTTDQMSAERKRRLDETGFIWDVLESTWEGGFAALKAFKARRGHCCVPPKYIEGTFMLGGWIARQRSTKDTMPVEHRQRLDEIGFTWTPHEQSWEEGFAALKAFKAREGHCFVPLKHIEGTFRLGGWVNRQRGTKDTMSAERRRRLDEIGISWDALESTWEEGFAALKAFKAREGQCNIPARYVEGNFKLGQWVVHQRSSKDTMSAERRQRLDEIGFVWDVFETKWETGFAALKRFKAREGHCNVPSLHIEEQFKLGQWVGMQRSSSATMSAERRRRLDEIGISWDALESTWEGGFAALKAFKAREGHCRVPGKHIDDRAFRLGQWVGVQRTTKDTMSAERRRRLDEIGFIWDVVETRWEVGFAALKQFKAREGHCRVPQIHVEGTFRLGTWVKHQRKIREAMPAQHRQRLDEIGMVWRGG